MAKRDDIVVNFRLQKIEQAEKVAKEILATVSKSKDLAKDVKQALKQGAKDRLEQLRALKRTELQRVRLGKRSDALKGRAIDGAEFGKAAAMAGGAQQVVGNLGQVFNAEDPLAAVSGALPLIGTAVGGPLGAIIGSFAQQIIGQVRQLLVEQDRKQKAELDARDRVLLDRMRDEARSNFDARFRDDPAFRRNAAREAFEGHLRDEARLADGGWVPSSRDDFPEGY